MEYGTGLIERKEYGDKIIIDGNSATISASVPKSDTNYGDERIYTNPVELIKHGALPSFSLVRFGKVKNFIDGVYASVEERVFEKGHQLSRDDFLERLETLVSSEAREYVSAAREGETFDEPGIKIPQGFYDWNQKLREAYKQIKILSKKPGFLAGNEDDEELNNMIISEIERAIGSSEILNQSYTGIQRIYAKITGAPENTTALFPSAELPDQELFKQLSNERQSDLEEGLGKLLVKALKEGRINFIPDKNSGLYLRQMNEITPLVLRDTEEFEKFIVNKEYEKVLENEFISQWAGTRHTHVGHSDFMGMLMGCCSTGRKPIDISPELNVEPFATSYQRMRNSISFLEETVRNYLPEVLDKGRLMNDGSRNNKILGAEFEEMKLLLEGLELISKDSIHMNYDNKNAQNASEHALGWIKDIRNDFDMNRNMAIFVPIIRTSDGKRQISYIDAGFKEIKVKVEYDKKPKVEINNEKGWEGVQYNFDSRNYKFPVLVHREVRIPYERLINDRELREMMKSDFSEEELDSFVKRLENNC